MVDKNVNEIEFDDITRKANLRDRAKNIDK
jgi:hypothetical protein